MGRALKVGPQNIGMPIGFQSDRMDPAQVPHQSRPGHIDAVRIEPFLQVHFQSQRQEPGDEGRPGRPGSGLVPRLRLSRVVRRFFSL